jgi:hypothetical protein
MLFNWLVPLEGGKTPPPVGYPAVELVVSRPANVGGAGFFAAKDAVEGFRVAVGSIELNALVDVLVGKRVGLVDDVNRDDRFKSATEFDRDVLVLERADVCRGPRILVLFRLILCFGLRCIARRSLSR